MSSSSSSSLPPPPPPPSTGGCSSSQETTVEKMHYQNNNRLFARNVPSAPLQPYLDVRPVATKYSHLPIVDPRVPPTTPLTQQPTYRLDTVFAPVSRPAPWSGYSAQVNTESVLRNQVYAIQSCSAAVYVPSSKSDLYETRPFVPSSNVPVQPFPTLFVNEPLAPMDPNPQKLGRRTMFLNNTRAEVRDLQQNVC
jgi:hypothetical protein